MEGEQEWKLDTIHRMVFHTAEEGPCQDHKKSPDSESDSFGMFQQRRCGEKKLTTAWIF